MADPDDVIELQVAIATLPWPRVSQVLPCQRQLGNDRLESDTCRATFTDVARVDSYIGRSCLVTSSDAGDWSLVATAQRDGQFCRVLTEAR